MTILLVLSCSSNGFEDKLCDYMEHDQPDCRDTTYWQTIDLQKVLNVEYDRLYIVAPNFEEDIRQVTHSIIEILTHDPTLETIINLPTGKQAFRHALNATWEICDYDKD